jgi:CBS domain-containing protein
MKQPADPLKGLRVRDVMSSVVKTLGRNDQVSLAADLMEADRIRHVPVLDEDGVLAGILSQRDLFRGALASALGYGATAQRKMLSQLVVKEVMTTEVVTTGPEAPLATAAKTMLEHKIGCLPVVEGAKLVGIVTESDFVALVARLSSEKHR